MKKIYTLILLLACTFTAARAVDVDASKVYTIKSVAKSTYAAVLPGASIVGMTSGDVKLSNLFTITPTTSDEGTTTYTIKSYADPSLIVYYVNTNDANANVGITSSTSETKINWTFTDYGSGINIIPSEGSNGWNVRGTESVWGNSAIGQWSNNSSDDNTWILTEVSEDEITAAVSAFKTAYLPTAAATEGMSDITSEATQKVGFPVYSIASQLSALADVTGNKAIFDAALTYKNIGTITLHTPTSESGLYKIKNNATSFYLYQEANDKNVTLINDGADNSKYYWKVTFEGNVATITGSLGMSPARGAQSTQYPALSSAISLSPLTLKAAPGSSSSYTEGFFLWENCHTTNQSWYTKLGGWNSYASDTNPLFMTTWTTTGAANQYQFEAVTLEDGAAVYNVEISGTTDAAATITYNGTDYAGNNAVPAGGFFVLTSPQASDFTAATIENYDAPTVTIDGNTIKATYVRNYTAQKETIKAAAQAVLDKTGVGYPTAEAEARTTLKAAISTFDALETVPEEQYNTLQTAVSTYKASTENIQLPEDGKAYTITVVAKTGVRYYMDYTESGYQLVTTTETDNSSYPMTAKLICHKLSDGKYAFANNAGKYFHWRGNTVDTKGYTDTYDTSDDITVYKLLATENNVSATQEDLFGYVTAKGKRTGASSENNFVIKFTDNRYDQASAPYYNDNFTSALLFEETTYDNVVTFNEAEGIEDIDYIATFSAPFPTIIPDGVKAYAINRTSDTEATTAEITGAIPAATGVLLTASSTDAVTMVPAAAEEQAAVGTNLLGNSAGAAHTIVDGDFILTKVSGLVAFYPAMTGTTLKMNRSYLPSSSSAVALKMNFGNGATGINAVETADDADAPVYDLAGRRVLTPAKGGLYIKNGKKFIR